MEKEKRSRHVYVWLSWALSLIPIFYLSWMILRYHVEVPFWDQWDFVPILEKSYEGELTFSDLWGQHNEHRLFFPKLIMLGLAKTSGWNHRWEIFFSLFLAIIIFLILYRLLQYTLLPAYDRKVLMIIPFLSWMIFSLNQAENWLWGWQIQIFLNVAAVASGIFLLAAREFRYWKLALAIIAGIVASYSYATGLSFWIVGLFILIFRNTKNGKKWWGIGIWVFAAFLTIFLFFHDYKMATIEPAERSLFLSARGLLPYILSYLGAPLLPAGGRPETAVILGIAGVILFASLFIFLRLKRIEWASILPALALGVYSFCCALMTGWGRAIFGWKQALSSRYVTLSEFLWISIIIFLWVIPKNEEISTNKLRIETFQSWDKKGSGSKEGSFNKLRRYFFHDSLNLFRLFRGLLLRSLFILILVNSFNSRYYFQDHFERMAPARAELFSLQNEDLLKRIYRHLGFIDRQEVERNLAFLKKYHLSVFRGDE